MCVIIVLEAEKEQPMKILKRQDCTDINICKGDSISLIYEDRVLCKQTLDREYTVNELLVIELEQKELDELGLQDGLGGIFGRK